MTNIETSSPKGFRMQLCSRQQSQSHFIIVVGTWMLARLGLQYAGPVHTMYVVWVGNTQIWLRIDGRMQFGRDKTGKASVKKGGKATEARYYTIKLTCIIFSLMGVMYRSNADNHMPNKR